MTASGDEQFTLQPVDELVPEHVGEGIAAWRKWVEQQGKTPEEERRELRRELSGAFGTSQWQGHTSKAIGRTASQGIDTGFSSR